MHLVKQTVCILDVWEYETHLFYLSILAPIIELSLHPFIHIKIYTSLKLTLRIHAAIHSFALLKQ